MDLHITTLGNGPTPVLALHCGLGRGSMWKGVVRHAPHMTITAPDLPGHGRSPAFPENIDVHDAATDAVRPLVREGAHLAGHSFGATVALRLALDSPERIASLTLVAPVFFAAAAGTAEHPRHRAAEQHFFDVYQSGDMLAAARVFNRLWGGGVPWDSFPVEVQQGMAQGMPFVAATEPSLWGDCHGLLVPGRLEALTCPVTFLRGEETVPIIAEVHRGLMARLPQAREVVVPGAGHMVTLTHAGAVAEAMSGAVFTQLA